MRFCTSTAALLALLTSHAFAFDETNANRYPSPDMYRPNVDRLIINGPGSTGPVDGMSVTPADGSETRTLSGWLGDLSGALTYVPTLGAKLTLAQWLYVPALPQWWGAACDGVKDDTAALKAWLAALSPTQSGALRAGSCRFTAPIQVQMKSRTTVSGSGGHTSVLLYDGTSTTSDIITIGNGSTPITGLSLSGFRVASSVTMNDGAGLRLRWVTRSNLRDIVADGQDGNGKLANGLWFDGIDAVSLTQYEARAMKDAIRINGAVGRGPKADLFLSQGKVASSAVGIHLGGAFGGLYLDQAAIINNGTNLLVDTALAAEGNREVFVGATTALDSAREASSGSIVLNDALTSNALISFTGTWNTTGPGHGLWVKKWPNSDLVWTGGTIGAFTDGVRVDDSTSRVTVAGGIAIRANRGWGVNPNVAGQQVVVSSARFLGNTSGDINPAHTGGSSTLSSDVRIGNAFGKSFRLDANSYWQMRGNNPIMAYDANTYTKFNRETRALETYIDGALASRFTASGLERSTSELTLDGALDKNGIAALPHGVSSLTQRILSIGAFEREPSGLIVAVPNPNPAGNPSISIDGTNVNMTLGSRYAGRRVRVRITYANTLDQNWP
ncbi:hypothetical protein [Methylobacterium fujisawaense]|uniref:hypothetical protein n=1 Tax=Methylobacterium fujisawaense TaxID=107400 RepID=UPI002F350F40